MSKLTVFSFGGGQDSFAISELILSDKIFRQKYAPGELLVLMSDTGDEHAETVSMTRVMFDRFTAAGIEAVLVSPDMGHHPKSWQSLRFFYDLKNTVGSKAFPKTCTDNLKIKPFYNYLEEWVGKKFGYKVGKKNALKSYAEDHGKVDVILGIASGEEGRVGDSTKGVPVWMQKSINRVYPLLDLNIDRKGAQDLIAKTGTPVPPPSNCMLCPWMSEQELLWLYRFHPADFYAWARIEANKLDANSHMNNVEIFKNVKNKTTGEKEKVSTGKFGNRNLGVWGKPNFTLYDALRLAGDNYGHMTDAELQEYKMSHGHCVKTKY